LTAGRGPLYFFGGTGHLGRSAVVSIRILLTFDDGPHAAALGGSNRTEKVLDRLNEKGIKGVFFVQTHVPYRLASENGLQIASRIQAEGHVLAIHTGSFLDHRCHKWRCTQPADVVGAINGLDSDMQRARAAIRNIAGADPRFVRATYGHTNDACMDVYARNGLNHVNWDIESKDSSGSATAAFVCDRLGAETKRRAWAPTDLIYLLHDISAVTAEHLKDFIDAITAAVAANGHAAAFVAHRREAESIMLERSGPGIDAPSPPRSMS
jgi:peptidoglycan/xylan/chitin deacetylase (PgdA/CDA1 family)